MTSYKTRFSLSQRQEEANRVLKKYPDRIPVIVESNTKELVIDKNKYLVPAEITIGEFIYVLRKRIKLGPEQGLYIFLNNNIIPNTSTFISRIYANHKEKCGFLFLVITKENTFGKIKNSTILSN